MTFKRESNGTEKAIEARKKWDAENLHKFSVAISKDLYAKAKEIADSEGVSFNRFVVQLIEKRIEEQEKADN